MKAQESTENYLETIYILSQGGDGVRSVDVSGRLNYSRPSVSIAMKKLRMDGYIEIDAKGLITLTDSGQKIAESIYEKHVIISDWLIFLGVDKQTAVDDACRIEHVISEQSFIAIKEHVLSWKRDIYTRKQ
ncbi:MAG: metal-dependent transcriptional regulator [Defluviitaleaceae bacterium]|nr:metal-dependent transcriptional regulator [Defluviitaleaceae bacterium]